MKQLKVDKMHGVPCPILKCEGSADNVPLDDADVHALMGKSLEAQWNYVNSPVYQDKLTDKQNAIVDQWQR